MANKMHARKCRFTLPPKHGTQLTTAARACVLGLAASASASTGNGNDGGSAFLNAALKGARALVGYSRCVEPEHWLWVWVHVCMYVSGVCAHVALRE